MQLEEYWGVGPKTREALMDSIGVEDAVRAIENGDVRALTEAGLSRGRATRILRRANGGEGMDVLATGDARDVYRELLDLIQRHAVTHGAADRIRVLTPLLDTDEMTARLDTVLATRDAWTALDEGDRERVLDAFAAYDEAQEGERAAVDAALALIDAGVVAASEEATAGDGEDVFAPLGRLDRDALGDASAALAGLDGATVIEGVDDELDSLRDSLATVERLDANALDVIEQLRDGGVGGTEEFQTAFVEHVRSEADVTNDRVRDAMPDDAIDATDFVGTTLRELSNDLRSAVSERRELVASDLRGDVAAAREDVDAAVETVDDIAFYLSLARFALAHEMCRPEFVTADRETVAVVDASNLSLAAESESVQPITYAIGEHTLGEYDDVPPRADDRTPPAEHRVAVVTGANSGGKTTLLETLCQIVLLAQMGLPVPASRAQVSTFDSIVFHRRHASFNAGVLESTLRNIVPPLSTNERTLMLVDEFEAITEPGSAADLLHGLVRLTVDRGALGAFVTHLADDLEPLPEAARTDGIFAEGLSPELELEVDYQPRFGTVGRSTPEFIVSRLVANADDRSERAGFETLAEAVGHDVVQRTLADARWNG
ncbi:MutS-related protein [Natranaeroarchaeum sulfidigenes]|uniref:DNA structure-specific ATPase involved in suppression of recombination, MutS family n=1 Tax=Natranaeroarchaeum sulfidigenes TaxID=2784880 RepID=A0A897MSA1_9EURY|nr:DNA mismatch repair protein [Natranaeroarchaeum sulfidigenes]QSG03342.1 DNA structure-specific ATPase involved in suppression of recombination, MutS family [Natranaeroarchaeum sulfidigenes]